MRAHRTMLLTAVASLALLSPGSAQSKSDEITLAEARRILGTSPVAIPGYTATLYRRSTVAQELLVVQTIDSGRVIYLFEDHDRPGRFHGWSDPPPGAPAYVVNSDTTSLAEMRFRAREDYRRVGAVGVYVLKQAQGLSAKQRAELLDRLAPIP